jgi:hypothetical protein
MNAAQRTSHCDIQLLPCSSNGFFIVVTLYKKHFLWAHTLMWCKKHGIKSTFPVATGPQPIHSSASGQEVRAIHGKS